MPSRSEGGGKGWIRATFDEHEGMKVHDGTASFGRIGLALEVTIGDPQGWRTPRRSAQTGPQTALVTGKGCFLGRVPPATSGGLSGASFFDEVGREV